MLCPNCPDTQLVARERLDCVVRICPRCGGVWLSRRELDKLSTCTGLFLKARGKEGLTQTGLKKPLWKELFDVEQG